MQPTRQTVTGPVWHPPLFHPGRTQSLRGRTLQSHTQRTHLQVHNGPQRHKVPRYLARTVGPLQPAYSFQQRHGTGQREPLQRQGGLAMVVQTTAPAEPYQFRPGDLVRISQVVGRVLCTTVSITTTWKIDEARESRVVSTSLNCKRSKACPTVGAWPRSLNTKATDPDDKCWSVIWCWQGVAPDYQTWISTRDLKQYE